jgi:uncharacterized membrane protein YcaP (DUF421 family)
LLTLVALHRVASMLRFHLLLGKLLDHRVRVPVAHGQVRRGELPRCGLTDNDLFTHLRQRGVFSIADLRYVLYEAKGSFAIVGEDAPGRPRFRARARRAQTRRRLSVSTHLSIRPRACRTHFSAG